VDKYLLVVMIFLIAGMVIASTKNPFLPGLFYSMLGGCIIVILYSILKSRKERKELRKQRRKSKNDSIGLNQMNLQYLEISDMIQDTVCLLVL